MKEGNLSRFLQCNFFLIFLKLAPWKISFHFLRLLTTLYFLTNRKTREIIRKNIDEVFAENWSQKEIDRVFRSTLRGIFHHYFEKLFLACCADGQWKTYFLERIRISGKRLLDQRLTEKKGLILVSPHFGALEFMPGFLTLLGYQIAIVAKFKTERLKKRCEEKASRVGATIIDANRKSSFALAFSALKEGRILITQCDEVECWKTDAGESIPLFGTSFRVDRTLPILQKRSGSPVVFGYVRREGKGDYTAQIDDVCGPDGTGPRNLAETILGKLEKLVYTHPDQWYIWKSFHMMKAPEREDIAVEDRTGRDFSITSPLIPTSQPSYHFPHLHRQYRYQASL